jgi:thymidylate synthase (FAD)
MKLVEPHVRLIVKPQINDIELSHYLYSIDAEDWPAGIIDMSEGYNDAEILTEFAGRLCYWSYKPGLNPNVGRVREDLETYLGNILSSRHGSVLEHSYFVFILENVSRVLTHELVRHRVGTSFSQESLRYVRLEDIPMWIPEWAYSDEELMTMCLSFVAYAEKMQMWMAQNFDLDNQKVSFDKKKKFTSFMRRFAPEGLATSIVFGANVRTLRHVIELRTSRHAEEEIRLVFGEIAYIMKVECPILFGDFEVNDQGEWIPDNSKV